MVLAEPIWVFLKPVTPSDQPLGIFGNKPSTTLGFPNWLDPHIERQEPAHREGTKCMGRRDQARFCGFSSHGMTLVAHPRQRATWSQVSQKMRWLLVPITHDFPYDFAGYHR